MREDALSLLDDRAAPPPMAGRKDIDLFEPGLFAVDRRLPAWSVPAAVLATLVLGAGFSVWQQMSVAGQRARTLALEAQATQLRDAQPKAAADAAAPMAAELARLRAQLAQLAGAEDGVAASEVLDALAAATLDGVWLTRIRFERETQALTIEGRTRDARLLPLYLQSLGQRKALAGMALTGVEAGRLEGAPASAAGAATAGAAAAVGFRIVSSRGPAAAPPAAPATGPAAGAPGARPGGTS